MTAAILSQIWRYSVYTVRHRAKRLERELRLGNRVGGALPVTSQAPLDLTLPKGREIGSRGFPRRVIKALGRRDEVEASGMLDALVASAARHSRRSIVLSSFYRGELADLRRRVCIGPDLVFDRLWRETGCGDGIDGLLADRGFGFDAERAI
jgi:hypothetical protein